MSINWGNVANIATTIGVVGAGIGWGIRLLARRLDHIDECLDLARATAIEHNEKTKVEVLLQQQMVKEELTEEETKTQALLADHVRTDAVFQGRIDRNVAWIAGKLGIQSQD